MFRSSGPFTEIKLIPDSLAIAWKSKNITNEYAVGNLLVNKSKSKREKTNERRNKQTNERTKERTNKRTSKRTNERTNGQMNKQTNEQMNERTNQWTNERTNERMNEQRNERKNKRTNERTNKRTDPKTKEQTKNKCGKTREITTKPYPSFESSVRAVFFDAATFPLVFPFPPALALGLRLLDGKSWQIGTEYSIRKKKYLVA